MKLAMKAWAESAVTETIDALRDAGLCVEDCHVLSDRNRLVFALEPCALVVKVAPSEAHHELAAELAVARHAETIGGPVARPDWRIASQPYRAKTVAFSLWKRMTILGPVPDSEVCGAYTSLRACLDSFAGTLPDFRDGILRAALLVRGSTPSLSADDAQFVHRVLTEGVSALSSFTWNDTALHGDAHSGNLVRTADGPRWLDFEAACVGPIEWDLCALPEGSSWSPVDRALLAALDPLRRACVVAWCATKAEPTPLELEALEHHLGALRTRPPKTWE